MGIKKAAPQVCPVCGEDVPRGAVACPECGADHNSGWAEEAGSYDALGLPDDGFNYEEFVEQEFGSSPKPAGLKAIWWITAVLVLAVVILACIHAAR